MGGENKIKVPTLTFDFGGVLVSFPNQTEMPIDKLCGELWDLTGRIENYMKTFPCTLTNKNGDITGIITTA